MELERINVTTWDDALPATGYEVFHEPAALTTLADATDTDLALFALYKGDNPVALFPAFVGERAVGRTVLSPPPGVAVPRIGPVLMPASPKRAKRERINRELAAGLIEQLDLGATTTLFRTSCALGYEDPRPFDWQDFDVVPRFTYVVDVDTDSLEEVTGRFSHSLRREMGNLADSDVTVSVEGADMASRIVDDVLARYAEQDEPEPFDPEFALDLVDALGDDARVYVARDPEGAYLSGIIVLLGPDRAYYWHGGVRTDYENNSVNSYLHREIIADLITDPACDSITGYDLVGANTDSISRYKMKFGADLVPYYVVESGGTGMSLAKSTYRLVGGVRE